MVIEPQRWTGVVLAGGRSSRMGRDKALLLWQGRPLIEQQIALLRAAGAHDVKVSGDRPGYDGIADGAPHAGPLGGIASIAAVCPDGELLIVPVDMPRLQPALLQRLRDTAAAAASVRFAGHVLPMRLRLDDRCRAALSELMLAADHRERALRALQACVGVSEAILHADEASQLLDCNTEASWREAHA
ncbi:molybdenum cofactor guanylyltransferase [Dyella jejuensis]|uniref:Molybdenum cofactor guanylyltransferase n=1 Tax=Dyella jejuensis TaxID=1432009 RepID=A0ABW8JLF2_9GAMM